MRRAPPLGLMPARALAACALSLALILSGCGSKKTIIQGPAGGNLPNNGFPTSANVQGVTQTSDPVGDWGFYTGEAPGRTDDYIDITKLWTGFTILDESGAQQLELEVPCGVSDGPAVAYCPRPASGFTAGTYLFISMQVAAPARQENTSPKDSGRYSIFLDLGDHPETEPLATSDGPDLASTGTDFLYQLVFGLPGGATAGADPNSVELSALDFATDTFPPTSARVWIHEDFVTWFIPVVEIPGEIEGVRAMAFWGDAKEQGNPALGGHDVVPGGVHAPYDFAPLPAVSGVDPSDTAAEIPYEAFLEELGEAIRNDLYDQLLQDLHTEVIDRYGEDACLSHIRASSDPTRSYEPIGKPRPEPWQYASDGEAVTIRDAVTIPVRVTIDGKTSETELHLAPGADGQPTWFTDCGTPVM